MYRTPLKSIRDYCRYVCKGNHPSLVKKCEEIECPLWDYRRGKNPHYKERMSEEEKENAKRRLLEARGIPVD